jgi:hypothetical protein
MSTTEEIHEGEIVDPPGVELEVARDVPKEIASARIVAGFTPDEILTNATAIATAVGAMIEQKGMSKALDRRNPQRKHVQIEGWQAAGAMLGALGGQALHAETIWAKPITDSTGATGWEARVQIVTASGIVAGVAESMCSRSENTWSNRDDYAIRGQAETRAESRAYRRATGWLISMAGYSITPAEEMPNHGAPEPQPFFGPPLHADRRGAVRQAMVELLDAPGIDIAEAVRGCSDYLTGIVKRATGEAYLPSIVGDALEEFAARKRLIAEANAAPAVGALVDPHPTDADAEAEAADRARYEAEAAAQEPLTADQAADHLVGTTGGSDAA